MCVFSQGGLSAGAASAGAEARGALQRLESRGGERMGLLLQMVHTDRQGRQSQPRRCRDERYHTRRFECAVRTERQAALVDSQYFG